MLDLGVEFLGNQGGGVEVNDIGDGVHLAHLHELSHDLGSALLQAGSQLTDGDLIGDGDLELGIAGLLQLDALQTLGLGLAAAAELLAAAIVAVVELFLLAGGLVLALAGHVAAVGQIVIAGVELIHIDIHGAGIHRDLRAVDLHLLRLDGLLDAGIGGQLLQGDALFIALLSLLFGLADFLLRLLLGFGLGSCLGLLRLCGGLVGLLGLRLLLFGLLLLGLRGGLSLLLAAGEIGVQTCLGILAGQGLQ